MIKAVEELMNEVRKKLGPKLTKEADCFEACMKSNLEIVAEREEDGSYFLITGDIPAMWLRDSACQLRPYLSLAKNDASLADLIEGVIKKQMTCINLDPYANAFMKSVSDESIWKNDGTVMLPGVWERKFEIDSLCFPFKLAYDYWKESGSAKIFDSTFYEACRNVLRIFQIEQYHEEKSEYRFMRKDCPYIDSLSRDGKGALVNSGCGLIWSGFRPSDDGCVYGYLIPSNMFAVVTLEHIAEIATTIWDETAFAKECSDLSATIRQAIETLGVVPTGSTRFDKAYYAYEVDGYGQYHIMDDANFPNLLSAPYLGYCDRHSDLYQETKKRMLSSENPYYYEGSKVSGIGSIHTKRDFIWPLSLGMIGLVSDSKEEKLAMIRAMASLTAGTDLMHESMNVDDPYDFTRPLFGWANAVYAELVLSYIAEETN